MKTAIATCTLRNLLILSEEDSKGVPIAPAPRLPASLLCPTLPARRDIETCTEAVVAGAVRGLGGRRKRTGDTVYLAVQRCRVQNHQGQLLPVQP